MNLARHGSATVKTPYEAFEFRPHISIEHELDIVWVVDPIRFEYVRESHIDGCSAATRWPWLASNTAGQYPLVAYATVVPGLGLHRFGYSRRYWFVKDYDRHAQPDGIYACTAPSEAVDPATILPRRPSLVTARVWPRDA